MVGWQRKRRNDLAWSPDDSYNYWIRFRRSLRMATSSLPNDIWWHCSRRQIIVESLIMRELWWVWMRRCYVLSKYVLSLVLPLLRTWLMGVVPWLDSETSWEEGQVPIRWYEYGTTCNTSTQAKEEGRQDIGQKRWYKADQMSFFYHTHNLNPRPPFF